MELSMANEKNSSDDEIAISLNQTETGVEAKIKSRAASAFDRLCGRTLDFLGLDKAKATSRAHAEMEAEKAIIEAVGKSVIARVETDPTYADRVIDIYFKEISRKQRNKDSVGKIAYDELKRLPSPDATSMQDAPEILDEDWLNRFESIAELASSERMQQLFGKILSGEIRKQGAFSLTTLRVASELSQRTAQLFHDLAAVRIRDAIVEFDSAKDFGKYLDLEVAGLVNFDGGNLARTAPFDEGGIATLTGDDHLAEFTTNKTTTTIEFPMVRLTTVGHELATLIPNDELRAFKSVAEKCKKQLAQVSLFALYTDEQGERVYDDDKPFQP
jgi:hypothetical protein